MTNAWVLFFSDSREAMASRASAKAIAEALGIESMALTHRTWAQQLDDLPQGTLCFLAAHGEIGEDGTLQSYLEARGLAHTHSSASTSNVLANKHLAKLAYMALDIPTPAWSYMGNDFAGSVRTPLQKALYGGGKQGISAVQDIETNKDYIYEEIVAGHLEISIPVLRRTSEHLPLAPIVRTRSTQEWGKLQAADEQAVPDHTRQACQHFAQKLSEALNCYGVTKTDFVIDKKGEIWAIETDAIPGLAHDNATALAAEAAGIPYKTLLQYIQETPCKTN